MDWRIDPTIYQLPLAVIGAGANEPDMILLAETLGAVVVARPEPTPAMRTPAIQEAYAAAILRGLQSYFASLAQTP